MLDRVCVHNVLCMHMCVQMYTCVCICVHTCAYMDACKQCCYRMNDTSILVFLWVAAVIFFHMWAAVFGFWFLIHSRSWHGVGAIFLISRIYIHAYHIICDGGGVLR